MAAILEIQRSYRQLLVDHRLRLGGGSLRLSIREAMVRFMTGKISAASTGVTSRDETACCFMPELPA